MKALFLFIILLPGLSFADSYFLKKITGRSSGAADKNVVEDLFESELADQGHDTVQDPRKAKYHLGVRLIRVGESYIISVKKKKKGKTVHADKMKASSIEEFDKVVKRLVTAVTSESKARNNPQIGTITEKEKTLMTERTETQWYKAFGFGPGLLTNFGTAPKKVGFHLSYSQVAEVTPRFGIRMTAESTFVLNNLLDSNPDTESSIDAFSAANLGLNYFLSTGNISPYVTGHLGLGAATGTSISDDAGFTWGAGAGVIFFRTSQTQMSLTLSYSALINSDLAKNPGQASFFISLLR